MSTRREFLKQAAVSSAVMASTSSLRAAAEKGIEESADSLVVRRRSDQVLRAPAQLEKFPRIKGAIRRDETILCLDGNGDNYHMSWAANDRQFVAVCDGVGWEKNPDAYYNSRLYTVAGSPHDAVFEEVAGYPELVGIPNSQKFMRYYGFGTIAIDGYIYQFLSTPNHQFKRELVDASPWPGARFIGAKLIFSVDNGRTWQNQNGSSPVVWEDWQDRSSKNMVFFMEQQEAFSLLSILQMGRNYAANTDGYVYVYAPNGNTEGTMNQLVMFRAPKRQLSNRRAYEYFAGLRRDGSATWSKELEGREVVHVFPSGWVNTSLHPWAWMASLTYNIPLRIYMMASWGTGCGAKGEWFGKPSYLGLWVSSYPWGPWIQIYEDAAWKPRGDPGARAFAPQIAPKWIAKDGKSFWLVWTEAQFVGSPVDLQRMELERRMIATKEHAARFYHRARRMTPYYAFNAQRVDLLI